MTAMELATSLVFNEIAEQLSSLQARLVEQHRHEVQQLRHHIDVLIGDKDQSSPRSPALDAIGVPPENGTGRPSEEFEKPKVEAKSHMSLHDSPMAQGTATCSPPPHNTLECDLLVPDEAPFPLYLNRDEDLQLAVKSPQPSESSCPALKLSDDLDYYERECEHSLGTEPAGIFNESDDSSSEPDFQAAASEPDLFSLRSRPLRGHAQSVPFRGRPRFEPEGTESIFSTGSLSRIGRKVCTTNSLRSSVANLAKHKTKELQVKVSMSEVSERFKIRAQWDLSEEEQLRMTAKAHVVESRKGKFARQIARGKSLFIIANDTDWFMIHPHSKLRLVWDVIALLSLTYDLITVPMQAFDLPDDVAFRVITCAIVVFWTLDIALSFITGTYVEGQLEMRFRKTNRIYLRSWFPVDVLVTGSEWVTILLDSVGQATNSLNLLRFLRGSRLLRVMRFMKLIRVMKLLKVLHDLDSRIRDDASLLALSVSKLLMSVLMVAHVMACAWYAVGTQDGGWAHVEEITQRSLGDRYLYSFQWALARLHPSNMSENMKLLLLSERMLAITTTMLAMIILSVFISTMTNSMAEIKKHRRQRVRKLTVTRAYCRAHKISHLLVARVKQYIDNYSERGQGVSPEYCEAELSSLLPTSLLMDLRHEAWSPVISRMDFFDSVRRKFRTTERDICHHALEEVPVFGGDTVFTTGAACSRMLFVVQGSLTYVLGMVMDCRAALSFGSESGDEDYDVAVQPGRWLSEAALWTPWENCGQLSATANALLLGLMVEPFMKVMRSHEHSMVDTAVYAKAFVDILNQTHVKCLTDLCVTPTGAEGAQSFNLVSFMQGDRKQSGGSFSDIAAAKNPVLAWELDG